jgi:hypothetical protein
MQLTSVILLVVLFIGVEFVSKADGETCSCSCCVGMGCKMVEKPPLSIPSCENDACDKKCKEVYSADCNSPQSQTMALCFSTGSFIFSRYTIFSAFILAFISMKGLSF